MGKVEVRKQDLLDLLMERNKLSVNEISAHFDISLPTARKMCALLAVEGQAVRTHGGIQRLTATPSNYSFDQLSNENLEEKKRIGQYAASLLENNKVVFFEAGTTVLQCVLAFAQRVKNNELTNMIVFTNSLINLEALRPACHVNLIGGLYRDERRDFTGYMSELALKGLHFDYCFIGADAVSLSDGIMAMDIDTVRFDRELVNHSEHVVILAHSDKLYRHSLLSFALADHVSYIITDEGIEDDVYCQYNKRGVKLIKV